MDETFNKKSKLVTKMKQNSDRKKPLGRFKMRWENGVRKNVKASMSDCKTDCSYYPVELFL